MSRDWASPIIVFNLRKYWVELILVNRFVSNCGKFVYPKTPTTAAHTKVNNALLH